MPAPTPNPGLNTNSGLGPGPGLIYPSPAGVVVRLDVVGWNQTTGQGQWSNNEGTYQNPIVTNPVGGISSGGIGDLSLTGYNTPGPAGTLQADITTGTVGVASMHVVACVDQIPTPTMYLGIFLDTSNRPFAVVTDDTGVIVAQSTPAGPVIPAGTPLTINLQWNAAAAYVNLMIGETTAAWTTYPATPWTPFTPAWMMVGDGFSAYVAFTGRNRNVQLGPFNADPPPSFV